VASVDRPAKEKAPTTSAEGYYQGASTSLLFSGETTHPERREDGWILSGKPMKRVWDLSRQ